MRFFLSWSRCKTPAGSNALKAARNAPSHACSLRFLHAASPPLRFPQRRGNLPQAELTAPLSPHGCRSTRALSCQDRGPALQPQVPPPLPSPAPARPQAARSPAPASQSDSTRGLRSRQRRPETPSPVPKNPLGNYRRAAGLPGEEDGVPNPDSLPPPPRAGARRSPASLPRCRRSVLTPGRGGFSDAGVPLPSRLATAARPYVRRGENAGQGEAPAAQAPRRRRGRAHPPYVRLGSRGPLPARPARPGRPPTCGPACGRACGTPLLSSKGTAAGLIPCPAALAQAETGLPSAAEQRWGRGWEGKGQPPSRPSAAAGSAGRRAGGGSPGAGAG